MRFDDRDERGKWLRSLLLGVSVSILITNITAMIVAYVIYCGKLDESSTAYAAGAITFISAFIGSVVTSKAVGKGRLMFSCITAIVYFGFLLILAFVLFEGKMNGVGATALLIGGAGASAGILGIRNKGAGIKRMRKMRF